MSKKKENEFKYSQCGEAHEEWPVLMYNAPLQYHQLSLNDQTLHADLRLNTCVIRLNSEEHFFISAILQQKIKGHEDLVLEYGLWVSLSEKSFRDYEKEVKARKEAGYFGWLCNNVQGYDPTLNIPCDVYLSEEGSDSIIVPHENHEHAFVRDFYEGISKEEAERRIHSAFKNHR